MAMIHTRYVYGVMAEIRPLNILLIDDDLASQFIIARNLENLGDKLDICSCPEKAIQRAAQCRYDLILIELNLPVVNGFELSKALRIAGEMNKCNPTIIGITDMDHPFLETLVSYSEIDDYAIRSNDYRDLKNKIVNHCYLHPN